MYNKVKKCLESMGYEFKEFERVRLSNYGYRIFKKARRKGYIKRGKGICLLADYNGRYGTGYSVFLPSNDSSRFVYVLYYIK